MKSSPQSPQLVHSPFSTDSFCCACRDVLHAQGPRLVWGPWRKVSFPFSLPKELLQCLSVSWAAIRAGPWSELQGGDRSVSLKQLQHICCMGWYDRKVCPQWDQQSFQNFKKTPNQPALTWELAGQWQQPLNNVFQLKHTPPPALWST